jgi:hypothetical protein
MPQQDVPRGGASEAAEVLASQASYVLFICSWVPSDPRIEGAPGADVLASLAQPSPHLLPLRAHVRFSLQRLDECGSRLHIHDT